MRRLIEDLKRRGAVLVITSCGLLVTRSALGQHPEAAAAKPPAGPRATQPRHVPWLQSVAAKPGAAREPRARRALSTADRAKWEALRDRLRQRGVGDDDAAALRATIARGAALPPSCELGPVNPTLAPLGGLLPDGPPVPGEEPLGARSRVTFGDVDGDGDYDLFFGDKYTLELRYLENVGSVTDPVYLERTGVANPMGGVLFGTEDDPLTPEDEEDSDFPAPALGDLDGDGDLDLLVGLEDGTLRYFEGGPVGTFTEQPPPSALATADVGEFAAPTMGDIDDDGDTDVSIGSKEDGIRTFLQGPAGTFTDVTGTALDPFPAGAFTNPLDGIYDLAPDFADIDGDGDLDALVGAVPGIYYDGSYQDIPLNGIVRFFENVTPGSPLVEHVGAELPAAIGNPLAGLNRMLAGPAMVDIDGDGDQDAFLGGKFGSIGFYQNTGTSGDPAFLDNGFGLTFADIDDDGDLDAFSTQAAVLFLEFKQSPFPVAALGPILFYRNDGTAASPRWELQPTSPIQPFSPPDERPGGFVTFGDMDDDGDLDAFVGFSDSFGKSAGVAYWENTGTAANPVFLGPSGFPEVTEGSFGPLPKPDLGDVDLDGDLDLIVGKSDGTIDYYRNDAGVLELMDGEAGEVDPFAAIDVEVDGDSPFSFAGPFLVDFDLDGDLDLFVGNGKGEVFYYENTHFDEPLADAGTPTYVEQPTNPLQPFFTSMLATPAFANLDADLPVEGFHAGMQSAEFFDQIPPAILVSPLSIVTSETGTTATFDVVLASQPDGSVTVGVASSDTTEGTVDLPTLTFDPSDWNVPQTVTVTGVDDTLLDGAIPYQIVLTNNTASGCYAGVDAPDVAALNLDDEPAFRKSITGGTLQAGGTVQYTVQLNNNSATPLPDGAGPEFQDVLPAQLELVSASADVGIASVDTTTDTVTWNGALAAGQTVTIVIEASIDPGTGGQTVSNQGFVLDTDGVGEPAPPAPTDDPSTAPPDDPTAFVVSGGQTTMAEIPTLGELAAAFMAAMLGLFGWLGLRRQS